MNDVTPLPVQDIPQPLGFASRRPAQHPERARVRAYEMFMEGHEISEIAQVVGCSRQYVYKLAKVNDWAGRRLKIASAAILQEDSRVTDAVELALQLIRDKLTQRVSELDVLCQHEDPKIKLMSIRTWLSMAGLGKSALEGLLNGGRHMQVDVHNDLSDNRKITVVQGVPQPEALTSDVVEAG